jgi:hypothetical protein
MPSPFPGMDPYLEHPDLFPGLHDRLITYMAELVQPRLPEPYLSDVGRRAWIEVSERYIGPDVQVMRPHLSAATRSSVALAEPSADQPLVIHVPHDEARETFVEIYIGRGRMRRLVTVIEVLSPANKTPGAHGRDLYLQKQQELLNSKVNLVEIDLLRSGAHTVAVPEERLRRAAGEYDYLVCLHRFDRFEDFFVHPIRINQPLPRIHVPLLPEDGSVPLDLQEVFDRSYDAGPYSREIDYGRDEPDLPLTTEQQAWAHQLLNQKSP